MVHTRTRTYAHPCQTRATAPLALHARVTGDRLTCTHGKSQTHPTDPTGTCDMGHAKLRSHMPALLTLHSALRTPPSTLAFLAAGGGSGPPWHPPLHDGSAVTNVPMAHACPCSCAPPPRSAPAAGRVQRGSGAARVRAACGTARVPARSPAGARALDRGAGARRRVRAREPRQPSAAAPLRPLRRLLLRRLLLLQLLSADHSL